MSPETTYPMTPSSNKGGKEGLSDPNAEPWTSDEEDSEPNVEILISDDGVDKFIDSITVTVTENVDFVSVIVTDENGEKVCFLYCQLSWQSTPSISHLISCEAMNSCCYITPVAVPCFNTSFSVVSLF